MRRHVTTTAYQPLSIESQEESVFFVGDSTEDRLKGCDFVQESFEVQLTLEFTFPLLKVEVVLTLLL